MQKEIKQYGLTIIVEGRAVSELVSIGSFDEPNEYKSEWIESPEVVDSYNEDFEDVPLTPSQEKKILRSLDINDFIE